MFSNSANKKPRSQDSSPVSIVHGFSPIPFEAQFLETFFSYFNLQVKYLIFSKVLSLPSLFHIQINEMLKVKRSSFIDFDNVCIFQELYKLGNQYQIEKAKQIAKEIIFWDTSEIWIEYLSSPELRAHILTLLSAQAPIISNELEQQLLSDKGRNQLIILLCQLPQEKIIYIIELIQEFKENPDLLEKIHESKYHLLEQEFIYNIERIREQFIFLPEHLSQKKAEIQKLKNRLQFDYLSIHASKHHLIAYMITILNSNELEKLISIQSDIVLNEAVLSGTDKITLEEEEQFEQFLFLEENEDEHYHIKLYSPLINGNFSGKFDELMALYQIIDQNKDMLEYNEIQITSPLSP